MYLLDTNALSELRMVAKGKANLGFAQWANSVDARLFFINHIVLLEQRKGILLKKRKDLQQGLVLEEWLNFVIQQFDGRILSISDTICWKCAELHVPNPRPQFDSLIASTALVHKLILVTRNVQDFSHIENLRLINPFSEQ